MAKCCYFLFLFYYRTMAKG